MVRKIPWRREWQPIPVFLPGEFHGQRILAGYSPWGCKELDVSQQINNNSVTERLPVVKTLLGQPGFDPWVGKFLWRREWQSTPVFLPGEFHGQRSLVGYSSWGHKEADTTE